MNKGIVMDIRKRSVVVLTPSGEFINCKRTANAYTIGQEIVFQEQEKNFARFSFPSLVKPVSLLFACFLCVFLFLYNKPDEKALAYVSIDINPSLEASVTKDLRVTELRACNDDGKRILKELKRWKNEPLKDVVRKIVKQSKEDGYLTSDKQVTLTSVAKEKSLETELQKVMQGLKSEYDAERVTVVYQESSMQTRENAQKEGMSTGLYIKRENEKKSSVPQAPPQEQKEQSSSENSQSDASASSNSSSNSSPVQEEWDGQKEQSEEQKEKNQSYGQYPKESGRNPGHHKENNNKKNNNKEWKQERKEEKKERQDENKAYRGQGREKQEQKRERKEREKENRGRNKEDKHGNSSKREERENRNHDR